MKNSTNGDDAVIPPYSQVGYVDTPPTSQVGYAVTCPHCGNEATQLQTVATLQGVGEGGLVRNTYTLQCATCEATA